jgi:hypothetical protein
VSIPPQLFKHGAVTSAEVHHAYRLTIPVEGVVGGLTITRLERTLTRAWSPIIKADTRDF